MPTMYILLKKINLNDMYIDFDEFKEALDEFACRPFSLGDGDYLILCKTLGGLTSLTQIHEAYQGIIVETTRFII